MKLTAALLIAVASGEPAVKVNRKVPPKHPRNRLARLNTFCDYLFNKTGWIKGTRTNGLIRFCNNWSEKMEDKVENSKCFFYDADQKPHGGPDPNNTPDAPKQHHKKWDTGMIDWLPSERKRRADDELVNGLSVSCYRVAVDAVGDGIPNADGVIVSDEIVQTCDSDRNDYTHPDWFNKATMEEIIGELDQYCNDDCTDNQDCNNSVCAEIKTPRGSGDKKILRLQRQGPWKGARSILTGFRKFGERYLANCHGHRAGTHMNRRYQYITRVTSKFLKHCDHVECNRDYVESKKFKWGKKNLRTDYAGK